MFLREAHALLILAENWSDRRRSSYLAVCAPAWTVGVVPWFGRCFNKPIDSRLEYLNATASHYTTPNNLNLSAVSGTVCVGDHYSLMASELWEMGAFPRFWLRVNTLALSCSTLGRYLDVHQPPRVSPGRSLGLQEWGELCHCPHCGWGGTLQGTSTSQLSHGQRGVACLWVFAGCFHEKKELKSELQPFSIGE